jgi:hypothetical protein
LRREREKLSSNSKIRREAISRPLVSLSPPTHFPAETTVDLSIMTTSQEQVLAQIGAACSGISTESSLQLTSKALVHLIRSGKLSVQDATDAVDAVKKDNTDAAKKKTASVKDADKRNNKPQEKHRTRHVALQFTYDGTDFTGFAQNIGKEEDNSVEKALFAALEKTRLLLDPSLVDFSTRGDASQVGAVDEKEDVSARTASKYSRCGRTDKGKYLHILFANQYHIMCSNIELLHRGARKWSSCSHVPQKCISNRN